MWLELAPFCVWSAFVAFSDIRWRRIPNRLVVLGFAAAIALFSVMSPQVETLLRALLGASAALAVTAPGYMFHRLGGGDVKAAAVMGIWGGVEVVLYAVAAAGVLSLCWFAIAPRRWAPEGARVRSTVRLPYGAFMAVGAAAAMLVGV